MYDLWLEQAISDYLFHEIKENVDALTDYIDCLENGRVCEGLEEHVFSRLDIYLEESYPLFETILELTIKSGSSDDYDDKKNKGTKEEVTGSLATSKTKVLTKEEQDARNRRKEAEAEFDKKTKGIGPLKLLRKKLGVASLRKKIADVGKKTIKKYVDKARSGYDRKALKKRIGAGIHKALDKSRKLKKEYQEAAKKFEEVNEKHKEFRKRREKMLSAKARYKASKGSMTKLKVGLARRARRIV